jgi:Bacterial Ig-like domain (group 3)
MTVNLRTLTSEKREVPMQQHRVPRGHQAAPRIVGGMPLVKEAAMSRKIQFICLFVLLGLISTALQSAFAQDAGTAPNALTFENNFFVTGDYAVGGVGLAGQANKIYPGYAVGTISMGADTNPGVKGANNSVPAGAEIVAALVYWQTVEIIGGATGQNGFFRPVFSGGPATGYVMPGTPVPNPNGTVYWNGTGCTTGKSTPKQLVTYLAVVTPYLQQDANGNVLAGNTAIPQNYEVKLPSQSSGTPLTLGATLVIIYRVMSPNFPLNSIVIYDGTYSPSTSSLTTTNTIQGFYQSDGSKSKLTYIVGNGGQKNESETVSLNGSSLPSLYGNQPPFPGAYPGAGWDNVTWPFPNKKVSPQNPVPAGSSAATLSWPSQSVSTVVTSANAECVTPAAVIFSTMVSDPDHDGLPPVLKNSGGYCDPAINNGSCSFGTAADPGYVPLPGAAVGQKDVFAQLDYMVDANAKPLLDQTNLNAAIKRVQNALLGPVENINSNNFHNVHLHVSFGNASQSYSGAITEQPCTDGVTVPGLCSFPSPAGDAGGYVGWKGNFAGIKNQLVLNGDPSQCTSTPPPAGCQPRFQHGRKDGYHYVMLGHAPGLAQWFIGGGTLAVQQSGNVVTFTTSTSHGSLNAIGIVYPISDDRLTTIDPATGLPTGFTPPTDTSCPNYGRVTITGAATNPNLNGTYCIQSVPDNTTFTVNVLGLGTAANTPYNLSTDPNLGVAPGYVTTVSGVSDEGGEDSLITLASWGPRATEKIIGGTIAHELGHTNALAHGGFSFPNAGTNDYTPAVESNCKANFQSVMSYTFQLQFAPLQYLTGYDASNNPLLLDVVDYSEQSLDTLNENSAGVANVFTSTPFYFYTSWYGPNSVVGGSAALAHCDGTPITDGAQYNVVSGPANQPTPPLCPLCTKALNWSANQDINFDGQSNETLKGYNDWANINFDQVGATSSLSSTGGGLVARGGGLIARGGGLVAQGGGLDSQGGGLVARGGGLIARGGGLIARGGGLIARGSAEPSLFTGDSAVHPPTQLFATEGVSPRSVTLTWNKPTGITVADRYNIYRTPAFTSGSPLTVPANCTGTQCTYVDTTDNCLTTGYTYAVSALQAPDTTNESTKSNSVPATGEPLLTGCYTVGNFSVPASAVQGSSLQVSWTLTDDFYATPPAPWAQATPGNPVNRQAANTLVAIGPLPGNCTASGRTTLVADGTPTQAGIVDNSSLDGFTNTANNFTFTWNRTDAFCAGSYTFELDLDHVNGSPAQKQAGPNALQLSIDINDQDAPHINPVPLPGGVVGLAYPNSTNPNYTLTEDGGTPPFKWAVTGLPSGISQQSQYSPTLSGTTCVAGSYPVMATVTDSAVPTANSGSQAFTLLVNKANTTTSVISDVNPSVFQQMVTFTVTVTPQYSCPLTGTVTLLDGASPIASNLPLIGGVATFTTSALAVGIHSITASYSNDANFNSSSSGVWSQTVNKASTQISFNSVSPATAFVGQPITISYTFSVVAPGGSSPIAPSGNITITATDNANSVPHNSSCVASPTLGGGVCQLSPPPPAAGAYTYTITYAGDPNFVLSGFNGNYTVYQLVFTAQPSNTGVGLTITPAVQVTAEDSSNNTFTGFTGGVTVAIGAGPGTLSGTTTQIATGGVATFGDLSINKIANGYTLTASPSGGVPDATSNAFNVDTFYVDNLGNFGTLDLASGVATQIGAATVQGATGIDLTPGLLVYEYNTSNMLIPITPSTGAANPSVGTGSIPDQATTGSLTDGSYFAIDVAGNLYSINLTTGATAPVGATSSALAVPTGCSFEASLTGSATVLYYTIGFSGASCSSPMPDTLYQVNPTTGVATVIGQVNISNSGVNAFVGSTFVGGTLYGFTSDGKEYAINPGTGVATVLANTTVPIVGAGSSQ